MRTCVVCRTKKPKADLLRHVCSGKKEQGLEPDPGQKKPGRGFYICKSPGCSGGIARFKGWRHKCNRGNDNDH
nr:YlxR family protein [Desulfonatronospira sp.]